MHESLTTSQFILTPIEVIEDIRLERRHIIFLLAYFYLDEIHPNPGIVDFSQMSEMTGYDKNIILQVWNELYEFGWLVTVERKDALSKHAVITIPELDKLKEK